MCEFPLFVKRSGTKWEALYKNKLLLNYHLVELDLMK